MKIIKPRVEFWNITPNAEELIEQAGHKCYKAEKSIKRREVFIQQLVERGHLSVLEHPVASFLWVCDRGVTHELVRHRIASYSQESTRYCDYGGQEIEFLEPPGLGRCDACTHVLEPQDCQTRSCCAFGAWQQACVYAEAAYKDLREMDIPPQIARSVLPNALKTEIVVSANLREWRHIFELRCTPAAHPQMRELALMTLRILKPMAPNVFFDFDEMTGRKTL